MSSCSRHRSIDRVPKEGVDAGRIGITPAFAEYDIVIKELGRDVVDGRSTADQTMHAGRSNR